MKKLWRKIKCWMNWHSPEDFENVEVSIYGLEELCRHSFTKRVDRCKYCGREK